MDKDYPARAAFGIVTRVQDDFCDQSRDAWRTAIADNSDAAALLEAAVAKYQVCGLSALVQPGPAAKFAGLQGSPIDRAREARSLQLFLALRRGPACTALRTPLHDPWACMPPAGPSGGGQAD